MWLFSASARWAGGCACSSRALRLWTLEVRSDKGAPTPSSRVSPTTSTVASDWSCASCACARPPHRARAQSGRPQRGSRGRCAQGGSAAGVQREGAGFMCKACSNNPFGLQAGAAEKSGRDFFFAAEIHLTMACAVPPGAGQGHLAEGLTGVGAKLEEGLFQHMQAGRQNPARGQGHGLGAPSASAPWASVEGRECARSCAGAGKAAASARPTGRCDRGPSGQEAGRDPSSGTASARLLPPG